MRKTQIPNTLPAGVSRRDLMKGLGIAAMGLGLAHLPGQDVKAQITATSQELAAYYRFRLGNNEMIVISDNTFRIGVSTFGANQPEAAVQDVFDGLLIPTESGVGTAVQNLVMITADGVVLFDTGTGIGSGKLIPTLAGLGIAAEDVSSVIISHFHNDHVSGLSENGALNFPNAQVYFPQPEFDFLQSAPENVSGAALGRLQPALDAGQVIFYNDGEEIIGGAQAVATHGHTPGHMSFLIESDGSQLFHIVDAILSAHVGLPHPDWHFGFDSEPERAVESRLAMLQRLSDEQLQVIAYHFPFPGIGYAARQGTADEWRWVPTAF